MKNRKNDTTAILAFGKHAWNETRLTYPKRETGQRIINDSYVINLPDLMGISNTLYFADLYEFKEDEVFYPEENSGSSSSEVEGTCIEQLDEWIEDKFEK